MQKQEKILILFKNILFLLKSIKLLNKTEVIRLKSSKLFFVNRFFILKFFINKKKYNKNMLKSRRIIYTKKLIYARFKKKKFNYFFLFNKFLFKNIKSYKSLNFKKFKINKKILFLYLFKKKKYNRFFLSYKKKKTKSNILIFIKRNDYYHTISMYIKKRLIFIKSSNIYNESIVKFNLIKKLMLISLKNNLYYYVKKYNFKEVILNFFLKKKRRLRKKGSNKYTVNFIDYSFFVNCINLKKFFKKLKVKLNVNLFFIRSHSIKTEKLKKKKRK